jgi:hypothetical protein
VLGTAGVNKSLDVTSYPLRWKASLRNNTVMDGLSGAADAATAGAANSVNLNVLKDTQNLSEDLVNRLFSTLGLGTNIAAQG